MSQRIELNTQEVFEMFCVMANLDPDSPVVAAGDSRTITSLIYRARAARDYQDQTGDIAIDLTVSN